MALSPQERSRRMRLNMLMAMSYAVAGRTTFTPLSLFSAGEVGAWYDPSDFSTMFQDSAGTTPVTAVEQPVGLIRDKSGRGNHASQTTSTSRPVLSARVNLLTYTEQFDNAAWTKNNIAAFGSGSVANADAAPNGTVTADFIVESAVTAEHAVVQSVTNQTDARFSVYAKSTDRHLSLRIYNNTSQFLTVTFNLSSGVVSQTNNVGSVFSSVSSSITSVGNGWYLCSVSCSRTAGTTFYCINISNTTAPTLTADGSPSYLGNGTSGLYIWGADLRPSNQSSLPYQRVGAATDYSTSGFPYYLSFDGTDDFLVTGTINPGAVDKAQVFAGVRKLSDAAAAVVAELSVNRNTNNGAFTLVAPGAAAANYAFGSKGTNDSFQSVTTYTAPITNVVTGIGDIANDVNIIRVNGTEVASSSIDQGTGNFLSYAMYIGRRGGTTLPFNGRLFGLIVRFSAANMSDADIARTETWLNAKTLAY